MKRNQFVLALLLMLVIGVGFSGSAAPAHAQGIDSDSREGTAIETATQLLTLTLTPYNPPLTIPASGGVFQYGIDVENLRLGQATFDVWTVITRPDGSQVVPAAGPFRSQVPAGWSVGRDDLSQAVAASEPAGTYTYTAYVGRYPDHAVASDSFTYQKLDGGGWYNQSSGTGDWLFAVDFADANNGWAVGQTNEVVHTTNGGDVWTAQSIPVFSNLAAVFALDAQQAWAGGDLAVLIHTEDGGATWVQQDTGFSGANRWDGIFFLDQNNGWVVGGKPVDFTAARRVILHTSDGGESWQVQYSQSNEFPLQSVYFVDADNGWAVGEGTGILHTSNGGATWVVQNSNVGGWLYDVHFTNANNGWTVGRDGRVAHTTDGGATWVPQSIGTSADLTGLHFADANHGWITTYNQADQQAGILATSNGGMTWNAQDVGDAAFLSDIVFANVSDGWAVGDNGRILHTDTGGN